MVMNRQAAKSSALQPAETLPPGTAKRIHWTLTSSQTSSSVQLRQKEGGLFRKCQTGPFWSFGKLSYCSEHENRWKRDLVLLPLQGSRSRRTRAMNSWLRCPSQGLAQAHEASAKPPEQPSPHASPPREKLIGRGKRGGSVSFIPAARKLCH